MSPQVTWKKFRSYSGPHVRSSEKIPPPSDGHASRAYWLTTKVETGGVFGAVMAYDGTCMTAGPDQHIAVYPKELANEDGNAADDQGSLWDLLHHLRKLRGSNPGFDAAISELENEVVGAGFSVGKRVMHGHDTTVLIGGRRIKVRAGDTVNGNVLRDAFTGPSGKVPHSGAFWDTAKRWATLWHQVTVHQHGRVAQLEFGVSHLRDRVARRKLPGLGSVEKAVYDGDLDRDLSESMDLAMCVYHAHSVNGPSPANRALARALLLHPMKNQDATARALLKLLGNSSYGRWDDDIKNGRWQRTRKHAAESGLWSPALFNGERAIMPLDLPG